MSTAGRKWKPGQKERFIATMKAKRLAESKAGGIKKTKGPKVSRTHDAIIFLRKAQRNVVKQIRSGEVKQIDSVSLYTLLALNALEEGD